MENSKASKIQKIEKSKMLDENELKSRGISYKTIGTTLQALAVQLDGSEKIYSEAGKMSWMTSNIKMTTKGQGISKMISRLFASESLFVNEFTCEQGTGIVSFSTDQAGKIIPIELTKKQPGIIFQRGSYLCSEENIDRSTVLIKKVSAGLFGGKGFILQKLKGDGRAHLVSDGEVVMYELKANETILVDQGNLIAYDETVDFDIKTVGGGIKNWLFGGEGIFLGALTGPGKIWLQTRKQSLINSANSYSRNQYQRRYSTNNPLGCIFGLLITFLSIMFFLFIAIISSNS